MKLEVSGMDQALKTLAQQEREMADEAKLREDLHIEAEPIAATARSIIRRLSGRTAADIKVRDAPSAEGMAVVAIGGSRGKGGRSWLMGILEQHGVGKTGRTFPFLAPAYQADGGGLQKRLMVRLVARFRGAAA